MPEKNLWTSEEIKKYQESRVTELGPLYASQGLAIDNPQGRAKYLCEVVLKDYLTISDHDVMMSIPRNQALNILEQSVIDLYF